MLRIVSLIASATEIVCALGLKESLVGRSHECDMPDVAHLPAVTKAKINVQGSSVEIDREVKDLMQNNLSVYDVDSSLLQSLKPDVILTQIHCDVCAVTPDDLAPAFQDWVGPKPKVVSLQPNALKDIWDDINRVADAVGFPEKGKLLNEELKCRVNGIAKKSRALPSKPTVACIEWIEPLMLSGNWIPELVERAGGINLLSEAGKHSPWTTWEDLLKADPDFILVLPCGFDLERTRQESVILTKHEEWKKLKAVKEKRVFIIDGNRYFNRPGPSVVESIEMLAEIFHPDVFSFNHEGKGWARLS